jgi:single-strand DNA-binding protein
MELITISGYVGKDAELKESNGRKYTKFSLAVDKSFKNREGVKVEKTNWWTVFSQNENLANHFKKGTYLTVVGEPSFSTWENDQRQVSVNLSLNLMKFSFGPSPSNNSQNQATAPQSNSSPFNRPQTPTITDAQVLEDEGDDLPF